MSISPFAREVHPRRHVLRHNSAGPYIDVDGEHYHAGVYEKLHGHPSDNDIYDEGVKSVVDSVWAIRDAQHRLALNMTTTPTIAPSGKDRWDVCRYRK